MNKYINYKAIKKSVEKLKNTSVSGSPYLAYLILMRHVVLQNNPSEISITGSALKPAVCDAALVDRSSTQAAFYSPLEGKYNTKRWGETNGPSDAINRWVGRDGGRDVVEKLESRETMTMRILPFKEDAVKTLLKIKDAGRPDIIDIAIWWYRDKDVENLLDATNRLTASALKNAFVGQLDLSQNQVQTLFALTSDYPDNTVLELSDNMADPKEYLPKYSPRQGNVKTYALKIYEAGDCTQLIDAVNASGFIFTPEQITSYLTAVRTKPFVILAGVSGTGKTHLPITLAEATGSDYYICSVHPDWIDSSALLGYRDITGVFHPGVLLKYAQEASEHPDVEYFFILDEMNLARVEYYLSDVLSKMETMKINVNTNKLESDLLMPEADSPYDKTVLPSNLCFVGSINMDESTQPISKKVLDRAFVLDFNDVDLTVSQQPSQTSLQITQWPSDNWGADRKPMFGTCGLEEDEFLAVTSRLTEINKILKSGGFNFGYRLRNEICAFIANAKNISDNFNGENTSSSAFDIALKTKVLSRIEGQGIIVHDIIKDLREQLLNNDQGDVVSDGNSKFQRTLNKLSDMEDMFNRAGYTSYWI